jgi:hypothetical protein
MDQFKTSTSEASVQKAGCGQRIGVHIRCLAVWHFPVLPDYVPQAVIAILLGRPT